MSVHFKFKNHLDHDFITFDGLYISVGDLRKSILEKKKIGKGSDFFLEITNAQTKEVYEDDKVLIPKNTAVLVARIPVEGGLKKTRVKQESSSSSVNKDDSGISYDKISKSADLLNAQMSEADKLKAMISQSAFEYDPSKYKKASKATGLPPLSYRCNRCGQGGHWINNCPTNDPNVKRSTGIPNSFMVRVDGPEHKGALLTSSGAYAVPIVNHQAYQCEKKEKPPFVPQEESTPEAMPNVCEELSCMICNEILQDAVTTPCCKDSFCDECIRQALIDSDEHECPVCHKIDVSPNDLVPNIGLRIAVLNFKNKYAFSRVKKATFMQSSPARRNLSPQCSPDSTVEIQPQKESACSPDPEIENQSDTQKKEDSDVTNIVGRKLINIKIPSASAANISKKNSALKLIANKISRDALQPSTPLADEPEYHCGDGCQKSSKKKCYNSGYSKENHNNAEKCGKEKNLEDLPVKIIETINNTQGKYGTKCGPFLLHHSNQPLPGTSYSDDKYRTHSGKRSSADGKSQKRYHSSYDRPSRSSRYHSRKGHHSPDSTDSSSRVDYHPKDEPFYKDRHAQKSPSSSATYVPATSHPLVYPSSTVLVPFPRTTAPLQPYALPPFAPGGPFLHTFPVAAQTLPPGVDQPRIATRSPNASLSIMKSLLRKYYNERNHEEAFYPERVKHDQKRYRNHISRRSSSRQSSRSQSCSSSETWSLSSSNSSCSLSSLFSSRSRSRSYSCSRSRSRERINRRSTSRSSKRQKTYSKKQKRPPKCDSRSPSASYSNYRSYSRSRSHNRRTSRSMSSSSRRRNRYYLKQKSFPKDRSRSHSKFRSFTRSPSCNRRKYGPASRSNEKQSRYSPEKPSSSKTLSRSTSSSFKECSLPLHKSISEERQSVSSQKKESVSKTEAQSKNCKHKGKNSSVKDRDKKNRTHKTVASHLLKSEKQCKKSKNPIDLSKNKNQQYSPQHEIIPGKNNSIHTTHKQHRKGVVCKEESTNKLVDSEASHTSKGKNEKESDQLSAKCKKSHSRNSDSTCSKKSESSNLTIDLEQHHKRKK